MENMDPLDSHYQKWVLINRPKIPPMPQKLSAQIVCPSPKLWDFYEKRLYCASVVRESCHANGYFVVIRYHSTPTLWFPQKTIRSRGKHILMGSRPKTLKVKYVCMQIMQIRGFTQFSLFFEGTRENILHILFRAYYYKTLTLCILVMFEFVSC